MKDRIQFDGITIDLKRTGTAITGHARFLDVYHRDPVTIALTVGVAHPHRSRSDPAAPHQPTAARPDHRTKAVEFYYELVAGYPRRRRKDLAQIVANQYNVSVRTIQLWVRNESLEGGAAVPGRQTRFSTCIAANDEHLDAAILIAAWWAFRIGRIERIQNAHVSLGLDLRRRYSATDILGTIDYYYAYNCDRDEFPFIPFSRWVRYHFDKWLHRARKDAGLALARKEARDALRTVNRKTVPPPNAPDPVTRKRDAHRRYAVGRTDRVRPERTSLAAVGKAAEQLRAMHLPELADSLITSAATPAPTTLDDCLTAMPDGDRVTLLRAVKGNTKSRQEAIATMPLWFDSLPESLRNNIDFKVDAWHRAHPRAKRRDLAARRVDLALVAIRKRHCGRTPRPLLSATGAKT